MTSPVFAELLFPADVKDVKIADGRLVTAFPDVKHAPFVTMLRWIYEGSDIPAEDIDAVSTLAIRFKIVQLKIKVAETLEKSVNIDNAFTYLLKCNEDSKELVDRIVGKVAAEAKAFMTSAAWLTMPPVVIRSFVARDDLAAKEMEIFEALLIWGRAECKREKKEGPESLREVLKDALLHIRFGLFTPAELSTKVISADVLPKDHLIKLFTIIGSKGAFKGDLPYPTTPRAPREPDYSAMGGRAGLLASIRRGHALRRVA